MKRKKIIREVLILTAWLAVIAGITTLLLAANSKQKKHFCNDVIIEIKESGDKLYIQKDDIAKQIGKFSDGSLKGKPVSVIHPEVIEKGLENNAWVRNAELFFDTKDVLHVVVEERQPIARVFTTEGSSFYIDSSAQRMPLLENVSTRLPVVIGFTSAKRLSAKDSSVLKGIRSLAGFIYYNDFWNAQIGEIVITEDQNFQLIPVIGDHTINIGSAENIEDKLHRLFVFYKQILSKTGFNKYRVLDVRFNGQVVAINKGSGSNIDSAQLKKNIEDLMQKARLQEDNSGMLSEEGIISVNVDTAGKEHQSLSVPAKTDSIERYVNQNISKPKKTAKGSKTTEKTTIEPKRTGLKKPKAVMKKRAH